MYKLRGIILYIIHANRMLLKIWPHLTFGWPFVNISLTIHPTHSKLYIFVILKAEQHPVVIFTMFCSLFQIVISFFERIDMHPKENFLRNAKISFKFEWINWFLKHWSQCGRDSSAYSFAYNFLSLIHNSPKWRHYVSGEPAALKWCIYCHLMLKFEGKSPKIYVQTHAGSHSEIISYYYRRVTLNFIRKLPLLW